MNRTSEMKKVIRESLNDARELIDNGLIEEGLDIYDSAITLIEEGLDVYERALNQLQDLVQEASDKSI